MLRINSSCASLLESRRSLALRVKPGGFPYGEEYISSDKKLEISYLPATVIRHWHDRITWLLRSPPNCLTAIPLRRVVDISTINYPRFPIPGTSLVSFSSLRLGTPQRGPRRISVETSLEIHWSINESLIHLTFYILVLSNGCFESIRWTWFK